MSARLLFIGTWNFADDYGNLDRSSKQLKARVFPLDAIDCEPLIQELLGQGLIIEYTVEGKKFLHIRGFTKHQIINRPSKPNCPPFSEDSVTTPLVLTEYSRSTHSGEEGKGVKNIIRPTTENANGDSHATESTGTHQRIPASPSSAQPKRGTRLPDDWTLPLEWYADARKLRPLTDAQIRAIAEAFRDYWVSAPKGVKLDWRATWRNWIRQQHKIPEPSRPADLWAGTL